MANKEKKRIPLRKPDQLDIWFDKLSKSKNPIVKIFYYLALSIWAVFAVIVGFILLIASIATG